MQTVMTRSSLSLDGPRSQAAEHHTRPEIYLQHRVMLWTDYVGIGCFKRAHALLNLLFFLSFNNFDRSRWVGPVVALAPALDLDLASFLIKQPLVLSKLKKKLKRHYRGQT